jgi:hypothetical protein
MFVARKKTILTHSNVFQVRVLGDFIILRERQRENKSCAGTRWRHDYAHILGTLRDDDKTCTHSTTNNPLAEPSSRFSTHTIIFIDTLATILRTHHQSSSFFLFFPSSPTITTTFTTTTIKSSIMITIYYITTSITDTTTTTNNNKNMIVATIIIIDSNTYL